MARRHTHELTIRSRNEFSLSDVEGRRLPELNITLAHIGKDENGVHEIDATVKILDAGDMFLYDLPEKLKKLHRETWAYSGSSKREVATLAMNDAEAMVDKFFKYGLFGLAVVDAESIGRKVYEYEPQIKTVGARVFTL